MSDFLPLVKKTYEFEGDTVTAKFKHLTRRQMLAVTPFLSQEERDSEKDMKLLDITINALKENMVSFSGLKDGEGKELSFDVISDEAYFTKLLSSMATDLMSTSMVGEKKQENAKSLSEDSSPAVVEEDQ